MPCSSSFPTTLIDMAVISLVKVLLGRASALKAFWVFQLSGLLVCMPRRKGGRTLKEK